MDGISLRIVAEDPPFLQEFSGSVERLDVVFPVFVNERFDFLPARYGETVFFGLRMIRDMRGEYLEGERLEGWPFDVLAVGLGETRDDFGHVRRGLRIETELRDAVFGRLQVPEIDQVFLSSVRKVLVYAECVRFASRVRIRIVDREAFRGTFPGKIHSPDDETFIASVLVIVGHGGSKKD